MKVIMRRTPILTIICLLFFINCFSQDRRFYINDSIKISHLKKEIIDINHSSASSETPRIVFPFASFQVKDVRFDTSYIGVMVGNSNFGLSANFKKVQLQDGVAGSFNRFLNDTTTYVFKQPSPRIICYLKQLRLTQQDSLVKEIGSKRLYNNLNVEIEAYLEVDNRLYPAIRFDSIATEFTESNKQFEILENMLEAFAKKAASIDLAKIEKRNAYGIADVEKKYNQRFNKPILVAVTLKLGVYKTIEEFINNNPSLEHYEFKKDSKATILYTKEANNEWLPTREVFGFCDGVTAWINVNNVFHPLIKQGNTFEFIADLNHTAKRKYKGGVAPANNVAVYAGFTALSLSAYSPDKYYIGKSLYQLNFEKSDFN
jgi:hypothetical protein